VSRAWIVPQGHSRFGVEGVLDFDTAARLLVESRQQFAGKGRMDIDLQGVRGSNSAGLALLLEWLELAYRQGISLRFRNLPESIARLAAITNLTGLLPVNKDGSSPRRGTHEAIPRVPIEISRHTHGQAPDNRR